MKVMEKTGQIPLLPLNPAPYLVAWLFEVGPIAHGPMGPVPIGWRDLAAWQELIGVELLPWEARILARLSGNYVGEMERAKKGDAAAPYSGEKEDVVDQRALVSRKVDAWFKSMKKKD